MIAILRLVVARVASIYKFQVVDYGPQMSNVSPLIEMVLSAIGNIHRREFVGDTGVGARNTTGVNETSNMSPFEAAKQS